MKKFKLLFAAVVFSAASVVGYNAYSDATMTEQEHLLQANLEALTNNEGGSGSYTCEDTITLGSDNVFYCGTCSWIQNSKEASFSATKTCEIKK